MNVNAQTINDQFEQLELAVDWSLIIVELMVKVEQDAPLLDGAMIYIKKLAVIGCVKRKIKLNGVPLERPTYYIQQWVKTD